MSLFNLLNALRKSVHEISPPLKCVCGVFVTFGIVGVSQEADSVNKNIISSHHPLQINYPYCNNTIIYSSFCKFSNISSPCKTYTQAAVIIQAPHSNNKLLPSSPHSGLPLYRLPHQPPTCTYSTNNQQQTLLLLTHRLSPFIQHTHLLQ